MEYWAVGAVNGVGAVLWWLCCCCRRRFLLGDWMRRWRAAFWRGYDVAHAKRSGWRCRASRARRRRGGIVLVAFELGAHQVAYTSPGCPGGVVFLGADEFAVRFAQFSTARRLHSLGGRWSAGLWFRCWFRRWGRDWLLRRLLLWDWGHGRISSRAAAVDAWGCAYDFWVGWIGRRAMGGVGAVLLRWGHPRWCGTGHPRWSRSRHPRLLRFVEYLCEFLDGGDMAQFLGSRVGDCYARGLQEVLCGP